MKGFRINCQHFLKIGFGNVGSYEKIWDISVKIQLNTCQGYNVVVNKYI